ncbi:MAG: ABC transporter permease, partial [Candidatus Geothermarchaeales archaeon]
MEVNMGEAFRKFVGDAKANWGSFSVFMPILTLLLFFVIIPIGSVLYGAFSIQGQFTIQNFRIFFDNPVYIEGFQNSLIVATFTVIFTSLIGIPLAYVLTRYDFYGKKVFQTLTLIPLVIAPFVGALGLLRIMGRNGTFNLLFFEFLKYLGILSVDATLVDFEPFRINFLMGLHGIILVETLHLYPLIYLNTQAALSNVDPSLEEQAKNLGAKGLELFRSVTFPLMLPGYAAGAILVFVWAFSDLGTPLMLLGKQARVMATQMFFLYTESGREVNPLALVMCVFMILVSFIFLFAIKKYVSLRQYATVSSGISSSALIKRVGGFKLIGIYVCFIFLIFFAVLPHAGVVFNSVSTPGGWSFTPLPQEISLDFWSNLIFRSPTPILNSLMYSGSAAILDVLLGATIAFLLARKKFPGKNLLDFVAMLPLAVPGLVIGFGYIMLFNNTPLDPFKGALN